VEEAPSSLPSIHKGIEREVQLLSSEDAMYMRGDLLVSSLFCSSCSRSKVDNLGLAKREKSIDRDGAWRKV
jgi:hypothetical protein